MKHVSNSRPVLHDAGKVATNRVHPKISSPTDKDVAIAYPKSGTSGTNKGSGGR